MQNQKEINGFPISGSTILSTYFLSAFSPICENPEPKENFSQAVDFPPAAGYTVVELRARRALRPEYNARVCLASASDGAPGA